MDGLGGRRQRPVQGFGGLGFWGVIVSAVMVLGALFVPTAAGAQDDPPVVVPGFCAPLSDVLDNAGSIPVDDEDYQQQSAEGAELIAALRQVAPAELALLLDELDAFSASASAQIDAAGGISGLTDQQREDLIDGSVAVLEPITAFYEQSCPGANIDARLYPECEVDGDVLPPQLVVLNVSQNPVDVVAGEIAFTVASFDIEFNDVPADLQPDDVLINGVSGLVEVGSCDDFQGDGEEDDEFASFFVATFTGGCPADAPPKLPRLEIGLTPEGQASLDEALESEPGPFPVIFDVDDFTVVGKFPGGLDLRLEADATVPEVSLDGVSIPVEAIEPDCDPVQTDPPKPSGPPKPPSGPGQPSAPGAAPSGPASAVAAPLAPKFTG
ncbi:MAG: hypothetical protein IPF88_04410 [Candidatus Microthrix sp.]|nr:hypothetical protein [Candidatus Microthrix sp.]MBK6437851.1 hypothetical protein [Candidatus Microthrix sp.]